MAPIPTPPRGLFAAGVAMVSMGAAEVSTGLTHGFVGLTTASTPLSSALGIAIGLAYVGAGGLTLLRTRWAARIAIGLLMADVLGRLAMVGLGVYPVDGARQIFAIVVGTGIVAVFAAGLARALPRLAA